MAWYDFLFGKGPLAKAAQQGDPTPPVNNQDAGIDVAGIAQQQADAIKKARNIALLPFAALGIALGHVLTVDSTVNGPSYSVVACPSRSGPTIA